MWYLCEYYQTSWQMKCHLKTHVTKKIALCSNLWKLDQCRRIWQIQWHLHKRKTTFSHWCKWRISNNDFQLKVNSLLNMSFFMCSDWNNGQWSAFACQMYKTSRHFSLDFGENIQTKLNETLIGLWVKQHVSLFVVLETMEMQKESSWSYALHFRILVFPFFHLCHFTSMFSCKTKTCFIT